MKKRFYFSFISHSEVYLLTVLLIVAVVVVPLTSRAIFRSQDQEGRESEELGDFRPVIIEHRRQWRLERRLYANAVDRCAHISATAADDEFCIVYWAAREQCLKDRRFGTDYGCPDINDPIIWEAFVEDGKIDADTVKASVKEPTHAAALEEPLLKEEDLKLHEQALLRRYRWARVCPQSIRQYLPGFYELCIFLVEQEEPPATREGMLSDLATVKMRGAAPEPTLKLRQAQWAEFGRLRPDR